MTNMKYLKTLLLSIFILIPSISGAQEIVLDTVETLKGRVIEVVSVEERNIAGLDQKEELQTIRAKVTSGSEKGNEIIIENDYLSLDEGDIFYFHKTTRAENGQISYFVTEPDRTPVLIGLLVLFLIAVFWIGGKPGIRGLATLVGSMVLIMYVFLPGLLKGFPPVLTSIAVSALIIIFGSYITHGKNKTTHSAVIGMLITIVLTGILATISVSLAKLTGFSDDNAVYLIFNTRGNIDMAGLLLGGILIGLLGVLYDVAIGQAVAVEELWRANKNQTRTEVYKRAIRIGREHIGALVDTLAIVYVGASLPLLLLFFSGGAESGTVVEILNREIFAEEIVRILVGSIGLIMAVPITTWIAVRILKNIETKEGETPLHHHH